MRHNHSRRIRFETLESRYMMAVLPGDYGLSGIVQADDYTIWKSNYGDTGISIPGDVQRNYKFD